MSEEDDGLELFDDDEGDEGGNKDQPDPMEEGEPGESQGFDAGQMIVSDDEE